MLAGSSEDVNRLSAQRDPVGAVGAVEVVGTSDVCLYSQKHNIFVKNFSLMDPDRCYLHCILCFSLNR